MHTKQYSINSVLTVDLIPRFRYRRKRHKNLASCISGSNRCSTSNKVDDAHPAYHIAPTQLTAGPGTLDEHSKNPSDGETTLAMQRCYPLGRRTPWTRPYPIATFLGPSPTGNQPSGASKHLACHLLFVTLHIITSSSMSLFFLLCT